MTAIAEDWFDGDTLLLNKTLVIKTNWSRSVNIQKMAVTINVPEKGVKKCLSFKWGRR